MLTIEQCLGRTIDFKFEYSSNAKRNTPIPPRIATFPFDSFVSLVCTENERSVQFEPENDLGVETFTIDEPTFDMLMKVLIKHDENDPHVANTLWFEVETLDAGKVTVLMPDIRNVSCETYSENCSQYRLVTKTDKYEISKEDYEYFKKMITEKESVN